jgi:hypothetical protein
MARGETGTRSGWVVAFEERRREADRLAAALGLALKRLRFEGKARRGANLRAVREALEALEKGLDAFLLEEELRLIPFLEEKGEAFDPVARLLELETAGFGGWFRAAQRSLAAAERAERDGTHRVYEEGGGLVCLVQNHLKAGRLALRGAEGRSGP